MKPTMGIEHHGRRRPPVTVAALCVHGEGRAPRCCDVSTGKEKHARGAEPDHVIKLSTTEDVGSRWSSAYGGAGVDALIEMDISANAAAYPQILKNRSRVIVYGHGEE